MESSFYIIKDEMYSSELVEKKSKFIAYLIKINSEEEAILKINEIKKNHRDAKHHVFAYRIENGVERMSDDGEPSGTAGMPILEMLRAQNLQNILVVVVRYFGGILLGTGGLLRAYTTASKDAICKAEKVCAFLSDEYMITYEYNFHAMVSHFLNQMSIKVVNSEFGANVIIRIIMHDEVSDNIISQITEMTNNTAKIDFIKKYYC